MALEKTLGIPLETGVPLVVKSSTGTDIGIEAQGGQKSAGGELKTYRNKDGEICALYAVAAKESDVTFEGLQKKTGYVAKDVGDEIQVTGVTLPTVAGCTAKLVVEEWEEVYSNEDVVKVRGKAHVYIVKNQTQTT